MAVAAFAWSLPPVVDVAGLGVPTPARLTLEAAPALRAGQRFVMLVMAGVAVLAGLGAARGSAAAPARSRRSSSSALAALRDAPDGAAIHSRPPSWAR